MSIGFLTQRWAGRGHRASSNTTAGNRREREGRSPVHGGLEQRTWRVPDPILDASRDPSEENTEEDRRSCYHHPLCNMISNRLQIVHI